MEAAEGPAAEEEAVEAEEEAVGVGASTSSCRSASSP